MKKRKKAGGKSGLERKRSRRGSGRRRRGWRAVRASLGSETRAELPCTEHGRGVTFDRRREVGDKKHICKW